MSSRSHTVIGFAFAGWLGIAAYQPLAATQTEHVDIQTYAGLTIAGEVGKVYSIEFVTNIAHTNDLSAWRSLEFLQLPASPYLWTDTSAPATTRRFYRVVAMDPPENMVFIPPGTFMMGSPEDDLGAFFFEKPQTRVIISRGFWMGRYEVTQGEYESMTGTNPSWCNGNRTYVLSNGLSTNVNFGNLPSRPVERASWHEATEYCSELTALRLADQSIPRGSAYRLPTEAEWEYACRALTSTRYSYGDDASRLGDYAWYRDNSEKATYAVGSKQPNPWGLYDMHGNAAEWCQDLFWTLPGGVILNPVTNDPPNPTLLNDPYARMFRGGTADSGASGHRSAARIYWSPDVRMPYQGFRVVLSPTTP
jgi:formylglycine-generating enzyme required for sulfatase activity